MSKNKTKTPAAAPRYDWPDQQEKRHLMVTLNRSELEQASRQLAETVPTINRLTTEAKASASGWKARIEAQEIEQSRLSEIVTNGKEERQVACSWAFECSGVDSATGERIYHPEKKALIRDDTGEVVEVRDITSDDRQMALLPEETEAEPEDEQLEVEKGE